VLNPCKLIETLQQQGVEFFAGVPDSLLNGVCTYLASFVPSERHVITANEGNAIAMATGYHLATGTVPMVYMQNSGFGNALNPLLSLTEKHVYSIPMVLLIGWRGQEGIGDHAQHMAQGRLTLNLLEGLGIPYRVLYDGDENEEHVAYCVKEARRLNLPTALVATKGSMCGEKKTTTNGVYPMNREVVIRTVLDNCPKNALYVATTGRVTRELYFLRRERNQDVSNDFLNVGAMGHTISIAQGLALANPLRSVVCLDGDASAIMHMGSFTMVSILKIPNLLHIVLNNGAHESVGGQPTVGHLINFTQIAEGCGYETVGTAVETRLELEKALTQLLEKPHPAFVDVRIRMGIRKSLPPLDVSPVQLKKIWNNMK